LESDEIKSGAMSPSASSCCSISFLFILNTYLY